MLATECALIPLRALNQVGYCPRLYYLEYVDAVMPINEHVEDGLYEHRRVNDPALEGRTRKNGDALHTRSLSLGSEKLGLTGKLDVLEEKDGLVYPVEYKRGSAPRDDKGNPTFWDNDAMQLCGQVLLLEETYGKTIDHAILFYIGSRERVLVSMDAALRAKTMEAIATIRRLSGSDTPPPPLPPELRHRCPGCSLVTICLPEETLYQLTLRSPDEPPTRMIPKPQDQSSSPAGSPLAPYHQEVRSEITLTRVIPQSDEGAVLYLQEPGSHVGRRSEHLVIRKDGAELGRIPIPTVRQVVLFGNVQVSTQAQQTLAECQIPVIYLSGYGRFIAALLPAPTKNISLRQAQYAAFSDPDKSLSLAKAVVRAKLTNQRTLLMRSLRNDAPISQNGSRSREESDGPGELFSPARASDEPAARDLAELLTRIDRAADLASLLGLEGQGASLYFGQFHRFLRAQPPGQNFDFTARNRRPPRDPVNSLLSFAYALLAKDLFSACCTVGFDPYLGFFHQGRHGKPSLALDLMEEFRSVIADSVVLTLINNRALTPSDFLTWRDACQLTEEGRKKFFHAYEQRKATVVTHPLFGYKMSYSRMVEVQARLLAAHLRGDIPHYTGFIVR